MLAESTCTCGVRVQACHRWKALAISTVSSTPSASRAASVPSVTRKASSAHRLPCKEHAYSRLNLRESAAHAESDVPEGRTCRVASQRCHVAKVLCRKGAASQESQAGIDFMESVRSLSHEELLNRRRCLIVHRHEMSRPSAARACRLEICERIVIGDPSYIWRTIALCPWASASRNWHDAIGVPLCFVYIAKFAPAIAARRRKPGRERQCIGKGHTRCPRCGYLIFGGELVVSATSGLHSLRQLTLCTIRRLLGQNLAVGELFESINVR